MHRAFQATAPPATAHRYDAKLTFDLSSPFQTAFSGVCANYAGIAAIPAFGLTSDQIATEWARVARSGVRKVSTWYDESWAMPSYPSGSPDFTTAAMVGFKAFLTAMQSAGVKVMIKMGWHFPQNVGALSGAAPITPTPSNEATFANWVSTSLNQFLNVWGFTCVEGCFFFTEPSTSTIGTIPGGYANGQEYYAHVVGVVKTKITTDDGSRTPILPRIVLAGPSEFSYSTDTWTEYLAGTVPTLLDGYSAHSYCNVPDFEPFGFGVTQCAAYQPWIDRFTGWVGDASPKPLAADESGFLVGGDSDSTGYRSTADCAWQWARQIDGHMQAGCATSYIWLLADQPILGDPVTGPVLKYGTYDWAVTDGNVKPSWYAISLMANLLGGGGVTQLFRCTGGTSTLHGTAAWIPPGQPHVSDSRGEWTFVVINEDIALDVEVAFGTDIGGRTLYRYAYSGEYVPAPASDPAYLVPWTHSAAGVTTTIPTTRHSGHSLVIYSTINLSAPTAPNLALTASVSSDSTATGSAPWMAAQANPSNVTGNINGWKKADDSSHYLEFDWNSAQTIGRVTLAFVATTAGVVYATYTDTSTPSPVSDYTVQYWDGAAWQTVATVSGNTSPNKSHTFGPVSTTKLRVNVTSVAATGQVNDVGIFAA